MSKAELPLGKILIVSNYYPPHMVGGAEVVAHRQAMMLRDRGWDICVFAGRAAYDMNDVGKLDVEERDGIPIYRLSHAWMDTGRNFRNDFANQVFTSLLSLHKPDWVHFHNLIGLGTELTAVAHRYGVKSALTLHDYWGICYRGILLRHDWSICSDAEMCGYCCESTVKSDGGFDVPIRLRRDYVAWCLAQVDIIISPSRSLANDYNRLGFKKDITCYTNGIDLGAVPARTRTGAGKVRFVCASYLGEHKGIPELLGALRILAKKSSLDDRWEFTLAGAGHIEQDVLTLAAELPGSFRFIGKVPRNRMIEELYAADVVVLASIWPENEPVSLLEALASGAGIIATNLGGTVEIVGNEGSGILCKHGDSKALADAMEELIEKPNLIRQMSRINQERAKMFDEEKTGDFLEAIYKGPAPAWTSSDRIIICGGGIPDEMSRRLIDAFAFYGEASGVRLLWQDWVGDKAWEIADGFWWWGERCSLGDLMPASSRAIPVCARKNAETRSVKTFVPLTIYHDEASFLDWIGKLEPVVDQQRSTVDLPSLRHFTSLRPRAGFDLP